MQNKSACSIEELNDRSQSQSSSHIGTPSECTSEFEIQKHSSNPVIQKQETNDQSPLQLRITNESSNAAIFRSENELTINKNNNRP